MIGRRLAQYEITEKLGEGGMGEVWRARDTTLDRDVAIKLLPEQFSQHPERLARFEREAKLLASLNHPGIAVIYGLHEEDGQRFLAMEFVPGQDLAKRLQAGPVGVQEALFIGVQLADALHAAHSQGVIHRDLKPANVILTPDGKLKVLDFGLAKAFEDDSQSGTTSPTMSPTVTSAGTVAGVILGTAAYMSPEQSRGKPLDRRTDIWSFGCVLFETLTTETAFGGESISDSIGAILHKEPEWERLAEGTPATVRWLLKRCLAKDRNKRLHDIADARIELEQAIEDPSGAVLGLAGGEQPLDTKPRWPLLAGVAAVVLVAGLALGWVFRGGPPDDPVRKFDLGVNVDLQAVDAPELALSPDGSQLAYALDGQVWLQRLDQLEPRALDGTEGATQPFWSPDGKHIGYFANNELRRISVAGGRSSTITRFTNPVAKGHGASWGDDGRIVVGLGSTSILEVPATGGDAKELIPLATEETDLHEPVLIPGGGIVFVAHPVGNAPGLLYAYKNGKRTELLRLQGEVIFYPTYSPTGHLLFQRLAFDGVAPSVWALPFSARRMEATGEPFLVLQDAGGTDVSADGTLAFVHRPSLGARGILTWIDRDGNKLEPIPGHRLLVNNPALSPDGTRLAYVMRHDQDGFQDVWMLDLERGTEARLSADPAFEANLLWTPSGDTLVFTQLDPQTTGAGIYSAATDGSLEPRLLFDNGFATSITPDGRHVLAVVPTAEEQLLIEVFQTGDNTDLMLVPIDGGEPQRLLAGETWLGNAVISPDGRWIVFVSRRGNRATIYLSRYPEMTGRWQIATGGYERPFWDPRGGRVYYYESDTRMLFEVSVGVEEGKPVLGRAKELFIVEVPLAAGSPPVASITPDGERFVMASREQIETEGRERSGIKIVQNWFGEFEQP